MLDDKTMCENRPCRSTPWRWMLDAFLGVSGVIVFASSVYFLYLPNGYQGGRNPYYSTIILFSREVWEDIHTWSGIAMILIALVHVLVHGKWFVRMARRSWQQMRGLTGKLNQRGRLNLWTNLVLAVSFGLCTVSGIFFIFVPESRQVVDPGILFSRVIWDLIHTWSGIVAFLAALTHFIIHWNWVMNTSGRLLRSLPGLVRPARLDGDSAQQV
jgi:predicted ferric reductase